MLIDGINLVEGSTIINLTVASGPVFPNNPGIGELFYKTTGIIGLHVYNGSGWVEASGGASTIDALDAAVGDNTISNAAYNQTWQWTLVSDTTALKISESVASTGGTGTQNLLELKTESGSTANPLHILRGTETAIRVEDTGAVRIYGGTNAGVGQGIELAAASSSSGVNAGGSISIGGGDGFGSGSPGGDIFVGGGGGVGGNGGSGGNINLTAGSGDNIASSVGGGSVSITAGSADILANGGIITITSGNGGTSNGDGGNILINTGVGQGTGVSGALEFKTGGNASASVIDNGTYGKWTFNINPYISNPESTNSNQLMHKDYVDNQDALRVAISGDSMSSSANLTFSGGGQVLGLPATPSVATAAASKAYVDNLVSGTTTWRAPIECPNLQDIVTAIPSPVDRGSYIKFGGNQNETWGSIINVVDNDIMEYTTSGGWSRLGVLTSGNRFIIAGDVGTAGAGVITSELRTMDLVEYTSGAANLASSWTKPHIGNSQGIMFGIIQKTGGSATGLSNDATVYSASIRVNSTTYPITITGSSAQTFTTLLSEINADLTGASASIIDGHIYITGNNETDTILITDTNLLSSLTDYTEIRGTVTSGTTVLVQNINCAEYGQSFLYSTNNHDWIKISGPGSIQAGVGLSYDGNILNISLGAGIQELPTDEIGLDLYAPTTGALILTTDGLTRATTTNSQLHLLLEGSTLSQSANGLRLSTTGVTASTYKSVTVDIYGRITAGTNPTTIDGYGITDAAEINPGSPKDGDIRVTGSIVDIYANGSWRQVFPAVYS